MLLVGGITLEADSWAGCPSGTFEWRGDEDSGDWQQGEHESIRSVGPKGNARMHIAVIQTGELAPCLAAAEAARARYPGAQLIGIVRETDMRRAACSGQFVRLIGRPEQVKGWIPWEVFGEGCQLFVVPFERRLGVYYWQYRIMPLYLGIPQVASFNRRGTLRIRSCSGWLLATAVSCLLVRPIYSPLLVMWGHLREWLDVTMLFLLALMALVVRGVRVVMSQVPIAPLGPQKLTQRVLLFIPSLGVGGAQRQLVTYLSRLDRSKWKPELVTFEMPDKFFEIDVRALGVPVTYLNPTQDFWSSRIVLRLVKHVRSRDPVVIHSWLHYAAMLGSIAGALAGTPVIVGSFRSERPGRFPWFYPKWQRCMDILTAPLHTTMIANSDAVRAEHEQWAWAAPAKLVTIYNGIDPIPVPPQDELQALRAELRVHPDTPLVGIVGRLSLEKDHRTFLDAARFVLNRRPDVQFLIVGEGPLRQQIEADVQRWGLSGSVKILGERKDALAIIRLLDVLVLTSRSEGFPNVLLEAAVVGTAVVTTAAGGAAEVVEDGRTGFVVPCRNSWAVGERVMQLLMKPDMRSRFAEAAQRRAETIFAATHTTAATEACYRDGLDRDRRLPAARRAVRTCLISPHVGRVLRGASRGPVGGAEIQLSRLAHALAKDDRFAVTVATSDGFRVGRERFGRLSVAYTTLFGRPSAPEPGFFAVEPGQQAPDMSAGSVARWIPAAVAAPLRWVVHRGRELRDVIAWTRLLGTIDADLYVMRCASPQVAYVRLATRLLRRKLVYLAAHDQDVNGAYAAQQGIWGRRFEWGLRRADAIVCQHGEQAMDLQRRYRRTPHLIKSFCPVDAGPVRPMPRTYILWMARLDAWKQPGLFIDLAERLPHEMFLMVGPASETHPHALDEWGGRIGALPNLRFEPGVPFEDTSALFAQAKLFVNTSREEGFPNTFLQAAACGTPIVSWSVNPDGILTRYQLGMCANSDAAIFEQAVRDLCGDAEFRTRLGENGRRYVARFHATAVIADEYARLLLELAGRRSATPAAAPAAEESCPSMPPALEQKSAGGRR